MGRAFQLMWGWFFVGVLDYNVDNGEGKKGISLTVRHVKDVNDFSFWMAWYVYAYSEYRNNKPLMKNLLVEVQLFLSKLEKFCKFIGFDESKKCSWHTETSDHKLLNV